MTLRAGASRPRSPPGRLSEPGGTTSSPTRTRSTSPPTSRALVLNREYCARVRARGERDSTQQEVYGDFTYLDDGTMNGTAFQWTGAPTGGACTPSCTAGYPGADDYLLAARGTLTTRHAVLHLEAARGAPELLRHRGQGPLVQQHRRLRVHAAPGVLPAQPAAADDLRRRDHALLLGDPPGHEPQRERRRGRPARGSSVELPEALDAALAALACRRRTDDRAAGVPVDLGRGRPALPLPGRAGADASPPCSRT